MTGWLHRRPVTAIALAVVLLLACVGVAMAVTDAGSGGEHSDPPKSTASKAPRTVRAAPTNRAAARAVNIYSHTFTGMLTNVTRRARYLIYAPDSGGSGVYVIDPKTYRVIRYIATGEMVQHVVPAWNLKTLYATNDLGNSLTPISPDTGKRTGPNIPVADPYNMYFTPDGRHAIVVEEAQQTLAFRDPQTFALQKALPVHCGGVDHMDFTAGGRYALASCEFSGQMVRIDLRKETVEGYVDVGGSPQDVKLSPDGRIFYVANRYLPARGSSGVQMVDARHWRVVGFIRTPLDAHGLYVSRNTRDLYVTDRAGRAVTVVDFQTRHVVTTWPIPGTPDMGGVSPDGKILWLAGRYTGRVYAISTGDGHVIASIPAGISPHGVCVLAATRALFDRAHRGHALKPASLASRSVLLFAVVLGCAIGVGELLGLAQRPDGSTGVDHRITAWVVAHRADGLTAAARVLATLGASKVLGPLVGVVAVALLVRGRPFPAALLVLAWAGSIGLYDLTKAVVARPRPPASIALTTAQNTSFPSGHATQSLATWATLAAICITLWPRSRLSVAIVVACLVAAIGWSRVYLGVHWMTDVVCGWAIAVAWVGGGSWLARRA